MFAPNSGAGDGCIIPGIHMRSINFHYVAEPSPDRSQHRLGQHSVPPRSPKIIPRVGGWA